MADLKKIVFYTKRNKVVPTMLAASTEIVSVYLRPQLFIVAGKSSGRLGDMNEIVHAQEI